MFQEIYKNAYDKISPQGDIKITETTIEEWMSENTTAKKEKMYRTGRIFRPIAAAVLIICLVAILGVPVVAKSIPQFYEVLERNAPGLADYLIPIQKTDSSQGIVLNLEAAKVEGNTAEVLVSFTDDGSGDYIHGMVDMYDSYHLTSYSGESNIGGCSFMEYDEEQDKAYFQINLISSDGTFDTSRMEFSVYQLLTDCESDTRQISLENIMRECEVKAVSLNGRGGADKENEVLNQLTIPGNEIDPRPGNLVLDIPLDNFSPEEMEITAVAYMDGILRVQLFRGNFKAAYRHMNLYMMDEAGNQIYPNMSVMWHDEVDGEEVLVDELYFVISEEQLAEYTLWGEGEVRAGSVKGDWSITFDVE